ncbi:hypothetical protein ElyMa_000125800 [Elysia marginata]|uniref:Uncharacterized protein n=1 Tax=Elysia marginata TaxID=1093978 RepID=A0AAV4ENJ7_9GAST|nr:hypothetical protein ElyMa_000125800 [Elysia marginata]
MTSPDLVSTTNLIVPWLDLGRQFLMTWQRNILIYTTTITASLQCTYGDLSATPVNDQLPVPQKVHTSTTSSSLERAIAWREGVQLRVPQLALQRRPLYLSSSALDARVGSERTGGGDGADPWCLCLKLTEVVTAPGLTKQPSKYPAGQGLGFYKNFDDNYSLECSKNLTCEYQLFDEKL